MVLFAIIIQYISSRMLKTAVTIVILALVVAGCGGKQTPGTAAREKLRMEGMKLTTLDGCEPCHHETGYVLAPSWREIAQRYKDNPKAKQILINSIKNGSSGKWTSMTGGNSMPPLYERVSDEDINVIVDYILSLSQ